MVQISACAHHQTLSDPPHRPRRFRPQARRQSHLHWIPLGRVLRSAVSTVPKPVESCRFENHDIAVFLGDVFFRIERQRFFLLQVFFPVISTGVI